MSPRMNAYRTVGLAVVVSAVAIAMPALAQTAKPTTDPTGAKAPPPTAPPAVKPAPTPAPPPTPPTAPTPNPSPTAPANGQPPSKAPPITPGHDPYRDPSDPAQSPLTWEAMFHDWGTIDETQHQTYAFKFTNNSGKKVVIANVASTCGCTIVGLDKKSYENGEAGQITADFNPQGKRGEQYKPVTVTYTEPAGTPNTVLILRSEIQTRINIEPIKTYMMEVDRRKGQSATVTFSGRQSDFQVTKVDTNNQYVTAKIGEMTTVEMDKAPYRQYPVEFSIVPEAPIGMLQANIVVSTNDEKTPTINYIVAAEVTGDLRATPQRLAVRGYTPNIPFTSVATLDSRSAKPFRILSVDVEGRDDMSLAADVETAEGPDGQIRYTVKLSGVTPDYTGLIEGALIVRTDLPTDAELRIPFSAAIKGTQSNVGVPTIPGAGAVKAVPPKADPNAAK